MSARHPRPRDCSRDYIIPAMPGQAVVSQYIENGEVCQYPVLAWYVEFDSEHGPEIIPMVRNEGGAPERADSVSNPWAVHAPGEQPSCRVTVITDRHGRERANATWDEIPIGEYKAEVIHEEAAQ